MITLRTNIGAHVFNNADDGDADLLKHLQTLTGI